MKLTCKTLKFAVVGLVIIAHMVPMSAHAIDIEPLRANEYSEQSSKNTEIRSRLCERYNSSRFGDNLDAIDMKVRDEFTSRRNDLNVQRKKSDTKRAALQVEADLRRQEHYTKLLENASSDAQMTAIVEFKQEVESAIEERRLALATARENYRTGADAAISAQRIAYDSATTSLLLATENAITKAKVSCEAGLGSSEVSATLKVELSSAREIFHQSTSAITPVKDVLTVLRETRSREYEQAKNTFTARMEGARSAFIGAFEDDSVESTD